MGSFNTTCFASGQTISDGNDCYLFAIERSADYRPTKVNRDGETALATASHSSTCYANAFWNPASYLFKAKYADYGQFEVEDCIEIQEFFTYIEKHGYNSESGENSSHDVPFSINKFKEFTDFDEKWEYFWEAAIRCNRVFVNGSNDNAPAQISFAVISTQAVEYLIKQTESFERYDDESNVRKDRIDPMLAKMQKRLDFSLSRGNVDFAAFGVADVISDETKAREVIMPFSESRYHECASLAEEFVKTRTLSAESKEQIVDLLNTRYLFAGFENLNIKIQPMIYNGQDYDNSVGKAYAKFVRSVSAQITKQQKIRYEE